MPRTDRDDAKTPATGDRMPPLPPTAAGGDERAGRSRPARYAWVVVFLPADEPDAGEDYAARLGERDDRFRLWGGRPFIVAPAEADFARRLGERAPFDVVADPDGATRRRWGLDDGRAALFVIDRWGQVFHAEKHAAVRDLATPDEIEGWLKYVATQCAECGVPDEPGYGEWGES